MRTENLLNRPIFGYASPRGFYRWVRAILAGLKGPKNIPLTRRVSLLRKGFLPKRQNQYGAAFLAHPEQYLSDRQYYKGHPYNGFYSVWIDDKMTMRYIFSDHKELFPKYYCWIDEAGNLYPLADYPASRETSDFVLELVRLEGVIAIKALSASSGAGFYKAEWDGEAVLVNGVKKKEQEFSDFVGSLRNYLLSEYIVSRKYLREINPGSTNTIRVNMINRPQHGPHVISSFVRFGTKASGAVDNGGAGGLVVPVLPETGELMQARSFRPDGTPVYYDVHPDNEKPFPKIVEGWSELCTQLALLIRDYPQLSYMGFDIAQTDDGFRIIEINSLNDLYSVQLARGVLTDPLAASFFGVSCIG